jgi:hypothetical protein
MRIHRSNLTAFTMRIIHLLRLNPVDVTSVTLFNSTVGIYQLKSTRI